MRRAATCSVPILITETFMKAIRKFPRSALPLALALSVCAVPMAGGAEEANNYLTVEEYIEQARPYLHLSCRGAWAQAGEDAEAYIGIIDKLAAIGFINHELDVEALEKLGEMELEAFRVAYYNDIGAQCRENPNSLLAGVVEEALLETFTRIQPDAGMR